MIWDKVWHYWKKFGRILGKIQTTIILSLIYYLIVTPIGLIKKIFLAKQNLNTYWLDIAKQKHNLDEAYKQY